MKIIKICVIFDPFWVTTGAAELEIPWNSVRSITYRGVRRLQSKFSSRLLAMVKTIRISWNMSRGTDALVNAFHVSLTVIATEARCNPVNALLKAHRRFWLMAYVFCEFKKNWFFFHISRKDFWVKIIIFENSKAVFLCGVPIFAPNMQPAPIHSLKYTATRFVYWLRRFKPPLTL